MLKKITKFIVRFILILGIVLGAIYFYVKGHKEEAVNFIVDTISENHNGTVDFDDVTLRIWGNFTNPAFHVKKMVILDSSEYRTIRFDVEDVYLNLSINSLLKENIQVKSLRVENMNYSSVTHKEDPAKLIPKIDSIADEKSVPEYFKPYKMSLDIQNINFDIQNIPRHKSIKFKINQITSDFLIGPNKITSSLNMDAHVTELGFNILKGSYLKNSDVKGTMYAEIDLTNNKIHIPVFDLSINDQVFKLAADFDTSKNSSFLFKIENEKTEYTTTVDLLSDHIQLKLDKYKFAKAISTQTTLQGSFTPFSNPIVHVKFKSIENSVLIDNRFNLENITFNGSFTNRIYDDERAITEDKRDLKLILNSLTGKYKNTKFELQNGFLTSTPEERTHISGILKATGVPEDLVSFTNNPSFTLKKGSYYLSAKLEGDATSASDLLSSSNINLEVINTDIFEIETSRSFPVKQLNVSIKEDIAKLEILKLPLTTSNDLNIYGQVSPFSSLLTKNPKVSAKTNFRLESSKLKWEDFLHTFANPHKVPKGKLKEPTQVLHDLAKKIYLKFDPSVTMDIKEVGYKDFNLTNFSSELTFSDAYNLHLNNTSFELKDAHVNLNASLDFEKSEQIILDAEVNITGTSEIVNDIFKSDTFFFKEGDFNLEGKVYGDILQMNDFLNSLNGNLTLANSTLLYEPNNLVIPIDLLDVKINNNLAILNALEIEIGTADKIKLSGRLENFSSFLSSKNTDQVNTFIQFHSDKLQWEDFKAIFQRGLKKESKTSEETTSSSIKKTLRGIYKKFNPKLEITIDRFEYKDLIVLDDFTTAFSFDDLNSLVLEESHFEYNKKTSVEFAAQVDISNTEGTNVNADFRVYGDPLHLNKVLNFDTFLLDGGEIEIAANITGDLEKTNELSRTTSATFKIRNSALIHNPSKVRIPFSKLEIDVKNDDAILKEFNIQFPSGDSINFSGELDNVTSILSQISGNTERMSSKLNIFSNKVRYSDFVDLFKKFDIEKNENNSPKKPALKAVVKDVYNKFQPDLTIRLNEFIFNKLIVNNFNSGFYFEDRNTLYLENTTFDFYNGNVALDGRLDISDINKTEFSIGFETDQVDLEKLLISFDYFNIPALKEAEKIDGKISVNTQIQGDFVDSTGLVSNSLKGSIDFNLQEMELEGFEPIIKIGNFLFKKERFENIRFGPIQNTIFIADNRVDIPLLQIQSTALDFFISGYLGYGDVPTNLWTAIPRYNFKKRDYNVIPSKIGYAESGKKFFVEAKTGKKNKIKYKLHLSEKKYFKERESLSTYREMLKENRKLLRQYKREARMKKN